MSKEQIKLQARETLKKKHTGKKNKYITFLLCALVVAFIVFMMFKEKETNSVYESKSILSPNEGIYSVSVAVPGDKEYTIRYDEREYHMEDDENFIPNNHVRILFRQATGIQGEFVQPADQAVLEDFGLDVGAVQVTIKSRDNDDCILIIGERTFSNGAFYAMYNNDIYLIPANVANALMKKRNQLFDFDIKMNIETGKINSIKFIQKDETILYVEKDVLSKSSNSMKIKYPKSCDADAEKELNLEANISGIRFDSYFGTVEEFFLDNSLHNIQFPDQELIVENQDGIFYRLKFWKASANMTAVIINDSNAVYGIAADQVAFLQDLNMERLASPFIMLVNISQVQKLRVTSQMKIIQIDHLIGERECFLVNGKEMPESSVRSFYQHLIELTQNGYTDHAGVENCLSVEFIFFDQSSKNFNFSIIDKDYCAVETNGEIIFKVNLKQVQTLITEMDQLW